MEETTPFQLATLLLVSTFKKYAEAEGKKDTLTKAEFRTLLDNEMPSPGNGVKSQEKFTEMMKDLDLNNDQEIDIMEYMNLVICMTVCCFEICKD
ncbi:protein S100-A2 [Pleuronectes platessa]|uniref:protein S100-A2 n=1 Tax=Pleuronectes platessa TaxID=8262 RepID=UPI00232A4426|nr:protein S100-A2 [Pleuronectes platessa]